MIILSWNSRGAGNAAIVIEIHEFARKFAPEVLGIAETQISKSRLEALAPLLRYDSCFVVGSPGRSGGLDIFGRSFELLSVSY